MPRVGRLAWRQEAAYAALMRIERNLFAWEWLRRSLAYRRAWLIALRDEQSGPVSAARFGLAALEDPRNDASRARPIWRAELDRHVVAARIVGSNVPPAELFDIRQVSHEVHVAVDSHDIESWRLGGARSSIRLDVLDGTLLGGPSQLSYRLIGLHATLLPMAALRQLVALTTKGIMPSDREHRQRARWVAELRVADAMRAGASQQEIGRALFRAALDGDWRGSNEPYRARVQRLVRAARRRLREPTSSDWFR